MNKTNPKIAIWYHSSFGRNDGPPLYYFNAMKNKMGLDVTHLAPQGDVSRYGKFDLHFWVDYGEDGLPVDHEWKIPQDGGKTIYVCSDAHIDEAGRKYRFETAKKFDYVFFNQQRAVDEYLDLSLHWKDSRSHTVNWLPHAAEPQAYPKFEILKKYDVGFIGHFQDVPNYNGITRIDFLDRMFKEFPNFYFGTRNPQKPEVNMFEDAAKKFGQSRIVLNISVTDDINMRVFEAMSSGAFLLTNDLPTLGNLFADKKHLVIYRTLDEAVELAKYYLEHEDEREAIAKAGHEEFLKHHTYEHRIRTILDTVGYKGVIDMPRGVNKKPDFVKTGEQPKPGEQTTDDLSPIDKGKDFVKAGERA
jgi:glycosyltransferase involved in cell wall biosynthesis